MPLDSKIFYSVCLGCKVNRAESDSYAAKLINNGWKKGSAENASLIIINTCTVTHVADSKARKLVRSVCKKNNDNQTKILVIGCSANLNPERYSIIDSRIAVLAKPEIELWIEENCLTVPQNDIFAKNIDFVNIGEAKILASDDFRTRASIKIQDGCNNACTYCIVHVARGKSKSLDADEVISKARALIDAGVKEINLTGINLGNYNYQGINLECLCKKLINLVNQKFINYNNGEIPVRFRLGSIEPQDFSDDLIKVIARSNGIICRHFHLPLQSGSLRILNEMHRKYSVDDYLCLVNKIRNAMPSVAISTDVIVGFPGETDDDFNETCEVVRKCQMMKVHVFPYSIRKGTPAAIRDDQISPAEKSARVSILQNISNSLGKIDLLSREGKVEYSIVESENRVRTESYHLLHYDCDKVGELIRVTL